MCRKKEERQTEVCLRIKDNRTQRKVGYSSVCERTFFWDSVLIKL